MLLSGCHLVNMAHWKYLCETAARKLPIDESGEILVSMLDICSEAGIARLALGTTRGKSMLNQASVLPNAVHEDASYMASAILCILRLISIPMRKTRHAAPVVLHSPPKSNWESTTLIALHLHPKYNWEMWCKEAGEGKISNKIEAFVI